MSMHKLSAGSGYDYLTRQVAAFDATDKGHVGLASYYTEGGESPGVWVGSGLSDVDGLASGDRVTAEQMRALFGAGMHPVDGYLGQPFALHVSEVSDFRVAVARAVKEANVAAGHPRHHPLTPVKRAAVRTDVAVEMFTAQHGRAPAGEVELSDWVATHTRVLSTAVAGFDLTFSPVKSISTLWAVADLQTAALVERAHQAAVRDALGFIEAHALFSRTGRGGIRQVEVTGMVAAAFTHRDSRAGDPDLHTHVAVANKVLTKPAGGGPGKWLSVDGRMVYKTATAASEVYNTSLERHLINLLGVEFADRDPAALERGGKRGVREVVGVDPRLTARWSQRRTQIEARQTTLAAAFRETHGRPPTPVEAIHLAQQANLETRDVKHSARSLPEQRAAWHTEAVDVLGDAVAVVRMVATAVGRHPSRPPVEVTDAWVDLVAAAVVAEIELRRATWQLCHVQAETQRQLRLLTLDTADTARAFDVVVRSALGVHSVSLAAPTDADLGIDEPAPLRRSDGTSVYEVVGRTRYSSTRILEAEARLLAHGATTGAPTVPESYLEVALAEAAAHGTPLNPGQTALVTAMAISPHRMQVAIAPAGTGKTTALRALASAWAEAGGNVLALAPSAAAAAVLGDAITAGQTGRTQAGMPAGTPAGTLAGTPRISSVRADTLSKLTHTLDHPDMGTPDWVTAIGPGTLLLVDEAGMADTLTLERAVTHALDAGATVRLVGDDQQLAAVGAGGILTDLAHHHGALRLDEVMRFTDPDEAAATTRLRVGVRLVEAIEFYLDHDRVHVADYHTALADLHRAWDHDRRQGLKTLMVAPTRDAVRDLNHLAQTTLHPAATDAATDGRVRVTVPLSDGLPAGAGDLVITRRNNRRLTYADTDWVKNGDRWTIQTVHPNHSLTVRHHQSGRRATLPADYVAASVELGYATTIHGAQGATVDTLHGLLTGRETRQDLYTMLTRGRHANHVYLPTDATTGDPHDLLRPGATRPQTAGETLLDIALHDGAATSATTELAHAHDPATRHQHATARFEDALALACEEVLGARLVASIETEARTLVTGIENHPAWPTLRSVLLRVAADGQDPAAVLTTALARGERHDDRGAPEARDGREVNDLAATLAWRVTRLADLPAARLPRQVEAAPDWAEYLQARLRLTTVAPSQSDRVRLSAHYPGAAGPDAFRVSPPRAGHHDDALPGRRLPPAADR